MAARDCLRRHHVFELAITNPPATRIESCRASLFIPEIRAASTRAAITHHSSWIFLFLLLAYRGNEVACGSGGIRRSLDLLKSNFGFASNPSPYPLPQGERKCGRSYS